MRQMNCSTRTMIDFEEFILDGDFPCVAGKAALARGQIKYCLGNDIRDSSSDLEITNKLQSFAEVCSSESLFVSFAAIYQNTPPLSETEFERYLWDRLQGMHNIDSQMFEWDEQVNSDPDSPHFSMSIGGKGFYIIGLHPHSNRPARQFPRTALVFNLHNQFELLRSEGSYAGIKETILARDQKLSGGANPMIAEYGQISEARQYSGRMVNSMWKCPFHAAERIK